jgi:hypothetical protein
MVTIVNTPRTGELINNRNAVQHELRKNTLEIDYSVFGKTDEEKLKLNVEKSRHKEAKRLPNYESNRNQLVERMLSSKTPRWGDSFRLIMESV